MRFGLEGGIGDGGLLFVRCKNCEEELIIIFFFFFFLSRFLYIYCGCGVEDEVLQKKICLSLKNKNKKCFIPSYNFYKVRNNERFFFFFFEEFIKFLTLISFRK